MTRALREMLAATREPLRAMHLGQVRRDPWPEFEGFARGEYSEELRRAAAVQWAGRARAEHGSVHQFSGLSHALCEARAPLHVLGSLARLITDEVRHMELCAEMARACCPDETFDWPHPKLPWPPAPPIGEGREPVLAWAARAILVACCLGETLSRPMLDAIATVATDPVAEGAARQILRDEHLHAAFGWEALALLLPDLSDPSREALEECLAGAFAGFEQSTTCGVPLESLVGKELAIEPGTDAAPNLGTLTDEQYAMIFYATIEREVLPPLEALGINARRAWAARPR